MDKSCQTCAHAGTPTYKSPCSECVDHKGYPMWERMLTELSQTAEDMKPDAVNHPSHYTSGCGFECIEMMEMVFGKEAVHDFCTLNAFKYLWRYRQKGGADDIGKAKWYLEYTKGLGIYKNRQTIDKMMEHIEREETRE